jgi:O-antigen ligase
MPSIVAAILTLGLVGYLFRRESRSKPNVTAALWLPFLWFFLIATRTSAQWMQTFFGGVSTSTYEEGTPMDAAIFFVLIIAGMLVLQRRGFNLATFVRHNRCLTLFLIYSLVSILWSDFMFVSMKRWIKIIGHPVMVLVLLSEPDPEEAITQMFKRCAFIVFPVSILFIKYYPEWGRTYDPFVGAPANTGISLDKNMLGCVCMAMGVFLFWHLLNVRSRPSSRAKRSELFWTGFLIALALWVLHEAHSATSLVTMLVALAVIMVLGRQSLNKRMVTSYLVIAVVGVIAAQWYFDLFDHVLALLGKDLTLTDRTKVWSAVLTIPINPLIGTGYECFWLGDRLDTLWAIYWWHPIQAHNGYLETYLNLGLIGLGLMLALLVTAYRKGLWLFQNGEDFARFRLGFLAAYVLYNWTEAAFKALHPVWFVFFIILLEYPRSRPDGLENISPVVETDMPSGNEGAASRA